MDISPFRKSEAGSAAPFAQIPIDGNEKEAGITSHEQSVNSDHESISKNGQHGVQAIETTTTTWSRGDLLLAYIFMWLIYFVESMQETTTSSLTSYIISNFAEHSLATITPLMANLIGNLFLLPLAKIHDIWGRPQAFAIIIILLEIGLIMMAACKNVQTYAGAQVFYWVGYEGLKFSLSVFIADTSALKNRAFAFALLSSPNIVTVWIARPLAAAFLDGPGARWSFGAFAIITPIIALPLLILFYRNHKRAAKVGLTPEREHGRTLMQSLKVYICEFDIVGLVLLVGGLAMFLLAFGLAPYQVDGWRSTKVICLIIFGGIVLISFTVYEKRLALKPFIPFELLTDRTFIGACILVGVMSIAFNIWNTSFSSFLVVAGNLDVTKAAYVTNIYTVGSCFFALVAGAFIRWTGRFKGIALYFGVPLAILGTGLMIKFSEGSALTGYIIMCQIFIAFASGTLILCAQLAVMAATTHQYITAVLAIQAIFLAIGTAIGETIAIAMWYGVFPVRLARYLPASALKEFYVIYASVDIQLSFPVGSATRDAINRAYGDAQKDTAIAATAVLAIAIAAVVVWRDVKVMDFKQVKGTVF